jgi:regulatory protein
MTGSAERRRTGKATSEVKDHDFEKIMRFCAFRPRHRYEVDKKMQEMGLCESIRKKYLTRLIKAGLVQDDVFLESYILGKLRKNRWGQNKIAHQLKLLGFHPQIVNRALKKYIDPEEYYQVARTVLSLRYRFFVKKGYSGQEMQFRCFNYMQAKGFEKDLIVRLCKELIRNETALDNLE